MGKSIYFGEVNDEKRKRRKSRKLQLEDFESVMHLKQQDAARELDVCLSSFKRSFASLNLKWPTPKQRRFLKHHRNIQARLKNICSNLGELTDNLEPESYFEFSENVNELNESLEKYNELQDTKPSILNNKMKSLYPFHLDDDDEYFSSDNEEEDFLKESLNEESSELWKSLYKKFLLSKETIISEAQQLREIYTKLSQMTIDEPYNIPLQDALKKVELFCKTTCIELSYNSNGESNSETSFKEKENNEI